MSNNTSNKYYEFILIAEEYLENQKAPKRFNDIFEYVIKKLKTDSFDAAYIYGEFHLSLILHQKFIHLQDKKGGKWGLRQWYTVDEIKAINKCNIFADNESEIDLESNVENVKTKKVQSSESDNEEKDELLEEMSEINKSLNDNVDNEDSDDNEEDKETSEISIEDKITKKLNEKKSINLDETIEAQMDETLEIPLENKKR